MNTKSTTAKGKEKYPVVMYSHGLNGFLMESLQKIQDGQLETCFSGRLAIEDGINLLGVSFGGCCSIGTLLKDSRAKCAINLDGRLFIDVEPVYTDKPVLVLCNPLNYTAYAKLKKIAYPNLTVKKYRKVTHWEFSDGIYLSERGKSNRQWADEISENRARLCVYIENRPPVHPLVGMRKTSVQHFRVSRFQTIIRLLRDKRLHLLSGSCI